MNHSERRFCAVVTGLAVITLGVSLWKLYRINHRTAPAPVAVRVAPVAVIGSDPSFRGDAKAPFTLVEFADFQCPVCIHNSGIEPQMLSLRQSRVRIVYRHFPLSIHRDAASAARAAEAARRQGKFWQLHDALFDLRGKLGQGDIMSAAQRIGLDVGRLNSDEATVAARRVEIDRATAQSLAVHSTPTYFLCGPGDRVVRLGTLAQLESVIAAWPAHSSRPGLR